MQSYGYVEAPNAAYMLTWIERGADALLQKGSISKETAEAFKAEAKQRQSMVWTHCLCEYFVPETQRLKAAKGRTSKFV
jgi:hypothetical protein